MDIDLLIFTLVLFIIIIVELSQERAFIIAQSLFPKKQEVLGAYRLAMVLKILTLMICVYHLFFSSN